MIRRGGVYTLIKIAMLKSVIARETVYMVRSVTKPSSRRSNIRLPVKHVFMQQLKMSGQGLSCANSAKLGLAWSSCAQCHVEESTQLSNSRMSLKNVFAVVLDKVPQVSSQASRARGEMYEMEVACKD